MNIPALLRRNAQVRSADIAFIYKDRRTSWSLLLNRVARLAQVFVDSGVKPGDRLAILMVNSDRFFEAIYAAVWAGAIAVPLNIRLTPQEIADNLDDCTPVILLSDLQLHPLAEAALVGLSARISLILAERPTQRRDTPCLEELVTTAVPMPDAGRRGDDPFAIFYTGGTTGRSKGVVLSHRNFIACGFSTLAEGFIPAEAMYLNMMPTFHVSSMWPAITALISGAATICHSEFVPEAVLQAIAQHRVTDMMIVPTMLQMLVEHPQFDAFDTHSLSRVFYGAAPITETLLARALEKFHGTGFSQGYGMTELSPLTTVLSPAMHHRPELRRAAGRAAMGVEVRIVDATGAELPRGHHGEIVARGDNVMLRYWNRPEETAAALRDGWMHTGDAGYMDDNGFVFIADRLKDMIITGGENVYSIEVENVLSMHPAVQRCAVIGLPDEKWGERVHAVVNLYPNAATTAENLIAFAKGKIASYKCPRSIDIRTEALPLSSAGKILKRKLRGPVSDS